MAIDNAANVVNSGMRRYAMLSVGSNGFVPIETNNGRFLLALDDVKPYANGQRLTMRIGNPNYARYSGFKLTVQWGKTSESEKHEKEFNLTDELLAGKWNRVALTLVPATTEELQYLVVEMNTDRIRLVGP